MWYTHFCDCCCVSFRLVLEKRKNMKIVSGQGFILVYIVYWRKKKHQRTFQKHWKCTRVTMLFIHKVPIWQTSTDWTYLSYVCLHRLKHKLTSLRLIFRQGLEVMSGSSIKIKFSSVYHSLENSFTIYVKLVCILVWNLCWELRSTSDNQEHLFLFSLRELFQ